MTNRQTDRWTEGQTDLFLTKYCINESIFLSKCLNIVNNRPPDKQMTALHIILNNSVAMRHFSQFWMSNTIRISHVYLWIK